MKYPCGLIQDLLPLYHDEVCNRESRQAVLRHLEECGECRAFYEKMQQAENIAVPYADDREENRKAAAFRTVRKKLRRRQVLLVIFTAVLVFAGILAVIGAMKNSVSVIMPEENNISVTITNGDFVAKLRGNRANYLKIKRVDTSFYGQEKTYLFFCMSASKWDDVTTKEDMFSVYTLCPRDKGAQDIDCVYYYTGEYTDIETMGESRLGQVIENSLLLWSR